jgi:DNA-binding MarR family transcriptional regulator
LLALNRDWKIRELADLEPREMRVLLNIGSYMPIKAADIAYQSRIDSYNVSRAVKALQKKGLIDIQPALHSRNIKYLVLNKQGIELYHRVTQAMNERANELESVLDKDECALFYSMLEKIEEKAERLLAEQAISRITRGQEPPADQKELIRWYKKSHGKIE